jgi:hypothetical protein
MFREGYSISTPRPAKYLMLLDFMDPLSGAAFAGFSQLGEGRENLRHAFHAPFSIAKTRALTAFFAKLLRQAAQNPVTRLWTACIRLKMNKIKACSFH